MSRSFIVASTTISTICAIMLKLFLVNNASNGLPFITLVLLDTLISLCVIWIILFVLKYILETIRDIFGVLKSFPD